MLKLEEECKKLGDTVCHLVEDQVQTQTNMDVSGGTWGIMCFVIDAALARNIILLIDIIYIPLQ